jgi:hypothetical protein
MGEGPCHVIGVRRDEEAAVESERRSSCPLPRPSYRTPEFCAPTTERYFENAPFGGGPVSRGVMSRHYSIDERKRNLDLLLFERRVGGVLVARRNLVSPQLFFCRMIIN